LKFLEFCVDKDLKDTHSLRLWGAASILRRPILVVGTIRIFVFYMRNHPRNQENKKNI
jgi:hypothetical protein